MPGRESLIQGVKVLLCINRKPRGEDSSHERGYEDPRGDGGVGASWRQREEKRFAKGAWKGKGRHGTVGEKRTQGKKRLYPERLKV